MTKKFGSRNGFSFIELVLGLTLVVIVIGIGYRALLSITRQQTSVANKANRLNVANSVKNAVIDYLGQQAAIKTDTHGRPILGTDGKPIRLQRFDDNETSGTYLLKFDPGDAATEKDHLTLKPTLKTTAAAADAITDYANSKYKIKVEIRPPEAPIFDRRVIVTVRNTDQAKGGKGAYEEETFEYFLVRPRASLSGGTVTLMVKNGNNLDNNPLTADDPDGANGAVYNEGVRRIKASIKLETGANAAGLGGVAVGEVRLAHSSSDGVIKLYGLPVGENLTLRLIGNERGDLISYYARKCDANNDKVTTLAEAASCSSSHPSDVWNSQLEYTTVINCPASDPEIDLGVVYMWPYTRVTGVARDYDNGTAIKDIGLYLKPIHIETIIPNPGGPPSRYENQYASDPELFKLTDVSGSYAMDVIPGYYYRAVFGSMATNTETPPVLSPIQDPDRRNLPGGEPDSDRNNDIDHKSFLANKYPYGLLDAEGLTHLPKYPAPVSAGEINLTRAPTNNPIAGPAGTYPKCMLLRPGVTYTQSGGRSNNPQNTHLRLKPMGDYKYVLRLAQWNDGANSYDDAPVQTDLTNYVSNVGLFLNVFNNFRKVYPFTFGALSINDSQHISADGTYVGTRMLHSPESEFGNIYGAQGGVAAGKASLISGAIQGDVPFMGASFFDPDASVAWYGQSSFFDNTQFEFGSYVLPFSGGWRGPLTPIIILTNPATVSQQLYVFYHGPPDFGKPEGEWLNGREDGMLFTVNPSMDVFVDQKYFPITTPLPLPTTSPPLSGYTINQNRTGLNAFTASPVHPIRWFRKALRVDLGGPAFSPTPPPIRVLPLSQLATVRGNILKKDGTAFSVNGSGIAQVSTWGVEYTPNDANPADTRNTGFVNFDYDVPSTIPIPAPSPGASPPFHTYEITRVVPTLRMDTGMSYGNGRKVVAKISSTLFNINLKFYNAVRFYEKVFDDAHDPKFYFSRVSQADIATSGVRLQVTNAAASGVPLIDSTIDGAIGNYTDPDDLIDSEIITPTPKGNVRITNDYKGESKLFTIDAGSIKSSLPADVGAPGVESTTDVDVYMDTSTTVGYPIYYVRIKPDTYPFVDAVAPATNLRGVPSQFCGNGGACDWYEQYDEDVCTGFCGFFHFYYALQDKLYGYKTLEPPQVKITIKDIDGTTNVPGVQVTLFTSSLKEYITSNKTNQWKERCTAVTDVNGEIDFKSAGTAVDFCSAAGSNYTRFDGFGADKSPGPDPENYSGLKNIRFRIESIPLAGRQNPCLASTPMACTFDAAVDKGVDETYYLQPITGPAPTNPDQSL